jgi:hypothetical protein
MTDPKRSEAEASRRLVEDLVMTSSLPMILWCDWWSTALHSFCHSCRPEHDPGSNEDEGQLIVPDPIEAEGDALFA